MNTLNQVLILAVLGVLAPLASWATPSTTYWAPSTTTCQSWAVPHLTYDTYFAKGAGYPVDTGVTSGILPFDKVQAEVGIDALYPTSDPFSFNAKICTPESSIFSGSPGLSFGIYGVGTRANVTNYDVVYVMAQKSLPIGGYVALGAYEGLNKTLFTNGITGEVARNGIMAAVASPDVAVGLKGLKKVNFVGDIQTGKNSFGAWGFGTNLYFSDAISLLTGPVFFLEKSAQPGGETFMWTVQLDIDVFLERSKIGQ